MMENLWKNTRTRVNKILKADICFRCCFLNALNAAWGEINWDLSFLFAKSQELLSYSTYNLSPSKSLENLINKELKCSYLQRIQSLSSKKS